MYKVFFKNGISMNIAWGTHHAFYDKAEGFCMLNDQAIAANYLLNNGLAKKILIIDLDVHQGNGTASILMIMKMFYFILSWKNYPFKKESDLDVEFDDEADDSEYLKKLENVIPNLIHNLKPDFIFYYLVLIFLKLIN